MSLAKRIASRFIKPDILQRMDVTTELLDNDANYLPCSEVFIGLITKSKLNTLLNEGDITQHQWDTFMQAVVAFYKASTTYTLKSMNLKGSLWEHATWINFFERQNARWSDVEHFCELFQPILRFDEQVFECLHDEFLDYRTLRSEELHASALEEAILVETSSSDSQ